jgi:NAD(P) transhydrogenase
MPAAADNAYELIVLGSGPAGRAGALRAAELGRRVALVEQRETLGGVCVNAGTIPSKALHAAVADVRTRYAGDLGRARLGRRLSASALFWPAQRAMQEERDAVRLELERAGVELVSGKARFAGNESVEVTNGNGPRLLHGMRFLVAVGSEAGRPASVAFDGHTVVDADSVLQLGELPVTLTVVGAGLVGVEYASIFAALGSNVTLVEQGRRLLPFLDHDLGSALTNLADGSWISSVAVLYAAGRRGATLDLGLAEVGIEPDERGCLMVDDRQRTSQPHVYAAGDVAGFPNLSSSSASQGRAAVDNAFGHAPRLRWPWLPLALHTVPELASIGASEQELAESAVPYVAGIAHWSDLSRGRNDAASEGFLKLLVGRDTRKLLGVQVFGSGAIELIHMGGVALALDGGIDTLAEVVFVHPTYAEAFGTAARHAASQLVAV